MKAARRLFLSLMNQRRWRLAVAGALIGIVVVAIVAYVILLAPR